MKLWVVYSWEQHEGSWGHRYFKDFNNAQEVYESLVEISEDHVGMNEIATED